MEHLLFIGSLMCVWIIVSLGANLVIGYTGLMALGHAAYLGVGAYTAASLNIFFGVNFFVAIAAAAVVTALVAVLTVLPLLRLGGFYFALATMGLTFVFFDLFHNLAPRIENTEGLHGLVLPAALASTAPRFATVAAFAVLCAFAVRRVVQSPLGVLIRASRDRPDAVQALGKNPRTIQAVAWGISGALTGLAGALYASVLFYIDPTLFTFSTSIAMLVFIGVGGLASIGGSILGPIVLISFTESLRFAGLPSDLLGPAQQALYGLLLVALMLFRRQGLVGKYDFHE